MMRSHEITRASKDYIRSRGLHHLRCMPRDGVHVDDQDGTYFGVGHDPRRAQLVFKNCWRGPEQAALPGWRVAHVEFLPTETPGSVGRFVSVILERSEESAS